MANQYKSKIIYDGTVLIDPNAVQTKINWVISVAKAIKNGDAWAKEQYGNNEQRRKALGSWYNAVQKQINVLYGIDKW